MRKYLFAAVLMLLPALFLVGCRSSADVTTLPPHPEVKYIFLLIGDGYGPNQRYITEGFLEHPLAMSGMTVTSRTGTDNVSGKTTDSAASGTAIACGIKTYNGAIGVDADGNPVESLAKKLQRGGFKIGIISSSPLNDATPAAHYAHRAKRGMFAEIGQDMAASGFDFFGGAEVNRADDILPGLESAGYTIIKGTEALTQARPGVKSYVIQQPYVDWTLDPERKDQPNYTLAGYLKKAIEVLDNPNGFFIMLENGHIDYSGHGNDSGKMIREVIAFDEAVQTALEFQRRHPDETLIIVTADHETGGLTIANLQNARLPLLQLQKAPKDSIIADLRTMIANDPATRTDGRALALLEEQFGYKFGDTDLPALLAQSNSISAIVAHAASLRDAALGFNYTTGGHSNAKIITNVQGPGAERFVEPLENSDLPYLIASIVLPEAVPAEYYAERQEYLRVAALCSRFGAASDAVTLKIIPETVRRNRIGDKSFELEPVAWKRFAEVQAGADKDDFIFTVTNQHPTQPLYFGFEPTAAFTGIRYILDPVHSIVYSHSGETAWNRDDLANFSMVCLPEDTKTLLLLADRPEGKVVDIAKNVLFEPPVITVTATNTAPDIDARFTEPVWEKAEFYTFSDVNGKPIESAAKAAFSIDPKHETLYIAVQIPDTELSWKHEQDGANIWEDDCIEIFLASRDQDIYYHIVANPAGAIYSSKGGKAWRPDCKVATGKTSEGWALEMALPLEQFGLIATLEGNICRSDQPAGTHSNLSPTQGDFHDRKSFIAFDLGE